MLFSDMKFNMEAHDLTTKQGRDKAMETVKEDVKHLPEGIREAVLKMIAGAMDGLGDLPAPFLLVEETAQELEVMSKRLMERIPQLAKLAKKYGTEEPKGFGHLVYSMGTADTYLTIAGAALAGAAESLNQASGKIAKLETKPKAENPPG